MEINKKIQEFLKVNDLKSSHLAKEMGVSQQYMSNILLGKRTMPLDVIVFLAEKFPQIDLNRLLRKDNTLPIVREDTTEYLKGSTTREKVLQEIGEILDKYY